MKEQQLLQALKPTIDGRVSIPDTEVLHASSSRPAATGASSTRSRCAGSARIAILGMLALLVVFYLSAAW